MTPVSFLQHFCWFCPPHSGTWYRGENQGTDTPGAVGWQSWVQPRGQPLPRAPPPAPKQTAEGLLIQFSSIQFTHSVLSDSSQPHGPQHTRPPCSLPTPRVYSTHVHWVGDAIQPSHPLSSPSPPAFNLSQHQIFSNESVLHIRWPKHWNFSINISPSNEHSGLISFRMDWLDVLAVQGTLKSLFQHHSSKASILRHSAFFRVQLSHPYMTNAKTIALTRWTFFGKVMSLLFNMLSRLVITFLPRSKHLLISWLQSPFA